jgi:hypothetical protein
MFKMGVSGHLVPTTRVGREVPIVQYSVEEGNSCWILEPNRILQTLVVIIPKDAINQFPRMAYFQGIP